MRESVYGEAAVEVLDILNHTDREDVEKIPQSFIKFLNDISNKNYRPEFDHEKSIGQFNLTRQTREILGFIYITWWCSDQEREKYKKQIQENSIIKSKEPKFEYDYNQIFQNKNIVQHKSVVSEESLIEYKKESVFRKVVNKILNLFGIKNERG